MIIPNIATAALALLIATSAAANQETGDNRQDANQSQPSQSGEESAHGYENPTGVDPDPRMTEQEAENAYERAKERDGQRAEPEQ